MFCPKCQHRNPDENRFCGQCGVELPRAASTNYPPAGYDEGEVSPVSEDDSIVSHFRRDVPPLPQSEYTPPPDVPTSPARHGHVNDAADQDVLVSHIPDVPESKGADTAPREAPSFGSSTGILFNLDSREPQLRERNQRELQQEEIRPPVDRARMIPAPPRRSEGIHGPSFLGLADGGDPDFLDDIDEPKSHSRRNWFLVALAIVIVLGIVEWRNIRQTGMNFAGSMKLSLPAKKGEQPKPEDTGSTDHPGENGPTDNGKPEIVVTPQNTNTSGQQNAQSNSQPQSNPQPSQDSEEAQQGGTESQPAGSNTSAQNASSANTQQAANSSTSGSASATPKQNQPTQQAKNDASNSLNEDAGDDNSSSDKKTSEKQPAEKTPAKPARAARSSVPPTATPGAEELSRANSAGSPETAAKWLWASTSKGNLDAPVRLADMYAQGRGVPKDCEQATVLLRSSARRGNPRASARLGMYYATGQCVGLDRTQAWHWLSLAHQRDPASDWITQYRQRLWSEMTPDERARSGSGPTANASE